MADKLVVRQDGGVFRIQWLLEEDDDYGAVLGDREDEPEPNNRSDWEAWKAQKVARDLKPQQDFDGFFWETNQEAVSALRVINAGLKQDRPLPEWSQKAIAEGWKPPKGWKS